VLAPQRPTTNDQEGRADRQAEQNALADAEQFLKFELRSGARSVKELREETNKAGLSWRTVERAKGKLGVQARHTGFGQEVEWQWHLPYTLSTPNFGEGGADQGDPSRD
jgi:hypothetical protein